MVYHFPAVASGQGLDPQRLERVKELVAIWPIDFITESSARHTVAEQQQEQERLHQIRTEPGLVPYLVTLANESMADSSLALPSIMEALAMREDLDSGSVDSFVNKADVLMATPPPEHREKIIMMFLEGTANILEMTHQPSHEDTLIKMLNYDDDIMSVRLKVVACHALEKFGTGRAIPAMERANKWLRDFEEKLPGEIIPSAAQATDASLTNLKKRIGSASASQYQDTKLAPQRAQKALSTLELIQSDATLRPLAVSMVIFVMSLMSCFWWIRRTRKKA